MENPAMEPEPPEYNGGVQQASPEQAAEGSTHSTSARAETPGSIPETKVDLSTSPSLAGEFSFPVPDKKVNAPALAPYPGMGKEDLLRFSQSPFWVRLRMACLLAFWLGWLAILAAVIGLTIVAPRCTAPAEQSWWERGVVYQVYVRSFYDQDGDGIGDLAGVEAKLDHIESMGVDAVVLSSIYETGVTGGDFGYDVIDHTAVHTDYGDMNDFESLLEAAHERGIRILLEFIPNHTGKDHPWFQESAANGSNSNDYWNYYVWQACQGGAAPPNNWLSVYGDSAWEYDATIARGECYLRQFLDNQPELNLRSLRVRQELEDILRFWLDKGVDGFRVNAPDFLIEDADLQDDPLIPGCDISAQESPYLCYEHTYTRSDPEVLDRIADWRDIMDEYSTQTGQVRVLLTDARNSLNDSLLYYGRGGDTGAHLPVNLQLTTLGSGGPCGGDCVKALVDGWIFNMPEGATATWLTGFQDGGRVVSALPGWEHAVALLTTTLPGVPLVYYGEEIGMVNGVNNLPPPLDPAGQLIPSWSRDGYRTPMQWSNETNGGFINPDAPGSATPWLRVNEDYPTINVQAQNMSGSSTLALYRSMFHLRRDQGALQYGTFHHLLSNANIFSFVREYEGADSLLVAINFGPDETTADLYSGHYMVPKKADVYVASHPGMEGVEEGEEAELERLKLGSGQGAVIGWPYKR